ncbi:NUDIX hydrolase [Acidocella aromatica]|uniref:NrtR DNA-binding winged helix domain-containing protein n=1 Tax=Acidocella aromatica TaxID=1303579 RepID=A0A840VRK5_9PROT|nr:hypothetical protein [Acidocella aromatica]MBB5374211.1 hypothetical protein [Acidocella aromatica]
MEGGAVQAELIAVLAAVTDGEPRVLTIGSGYALPSGPLEEGHRSLQTGLRAWVERQTHHPLGYVEQLYTFAGQLPGAARGISISYLGLSREAMTEYPGAEWHGWYEYFPWEDARHSRSAPYVAAILPRLRAWAGDDAARQTRVEGLFGAEGWNEELVLQRYELLWEAALVPEARRPHTDEGGTVPGREMTHDHRRILATAIARLRAKIKYRPVVFELLPREFTMLELQQTMEALAGQTLHKPNFRRLIEQQELVEETGKTTSGLAGRPAKLFRFRQAVLEERGVSGTKLPRVK